MFFIVMLYVLTHRNDFLVESLDFTFLIADCREKRVELFVFDRKRILLLDTDNEIGEYIHVVCKCLERRFVG